MANDVMLRTEHEASLSRARKAIHAAYSVVGRDDATREERTKVAAALVAAIDDVAWLAALEPAEWATAAAALATGSAFAEHARRIKSAVRESAKAKQRALLDERRKQAKPVVVTRQGATPDAFITRATPSVMVRLDRKIRMVDGVPEPGDPKPCLSNLVTILTEDPHCKDKIRFNSFTCMVEVDGIEKTDDLDTHVAIAIHRAYDLEAPTEKVREALAYVARRYGAYDPLVDYLLGLKWDGTPRLATFFQDYFAVKTPTVYDPKSHAIVPAPSLLAAASRCFFVGLVARGLDPGCKLDTQVVLAGLGGKGKSRGIAALCPKPEWFSDTQIDLRDKDRFQALDGIWICENAEMDMLSSTALTRLKGFLSSSADRYRRPYDRTPQRHPRRTGFIGSTNEEEIGKDRRFHPLDVDDNSKVRVEDIARVRDQLWAEAVVLYKAGTKWYLTDTEFTRMVDHAEKYRVVHPWEAPIADWLNDPQSRMRYRAGGFHVADVLADALKLDARAQDQRASMFATRILKDSFGCKKERSQTGHVRERRWFYPGWEA